MEKMSEQAGRACKEDIMRSKGLRIIAEAVLAATLAVMTNGCGGGYGGSGSGGVYQTPMPPAPSPRPTM